MSENAIENFVEKQNIIRSGRNKFILVIHLISCFCLLSILFLLLFFIAELSAIFSLLLSILFSSFYFLKFKPQKISGINYKEFLSYLEIKHPDTPVPPSRIDQPNASERQKASNSQAWSAKLNIEEAQFKEDIEATNFQVFRRTGALCLILLVVIFGLNQQIKGSINEISTIVNAFTKKNTLEIKEGILNEKDKNLLPITKGKTETLSLLPQNLIEIKLSMPFSKTPPVLSLVKMNGDEKRVFQEFQMSPVRDLTTGKIIDKYYQISFSTDNSVDVMIDQFSGSVPVASINIEKLPVPEITVEFFSKDRQDPWPDEKSILVDIEAQATNPLRTIKLLITSSGKTSEELVANILKTDQKTYKETYSLILERYVDQDIAEVEIIAEATDRATPKPLVGYSEPIRITTASAYGRYQATLQRLKDIKSIIDRGKEDGKYDISKELSSKTDKIKQLAEDTPFFDVIDRMTIKSITAELNSLAKKKNEKKTILLSFRLDEFLFEHEMLDDRERDRDFFVAARSLSRILEKPKKDRRIDINFAIAKVKSFLEQRRRRWEIRLKRLEPDFKPQSAAAVMGSKPFLTDMNKIIQEEKLSDDVRENSLVILSKAVPKYRKWIEELEQAEDKSREAKERQRQQSLKQKEDQLKKLQKQQAEVSKELDKAAKRDKKDLEKNWQKTKNLENQIRQQTLQVASQMQMMAPEAAERVMGAAQAMNVTMSEGDKSNFVRAESAADLAGRLLRQAQSKAQQRRSQGGQGRQRKRRRVSGDNYFGRAVMGGDVAIQRTYEVDKRYREAILNEIRSSDVTPEDKKLLDKYLRETVR